MEELQQELTELENKYRELELEQKETEQKLHGYEDFVADLNKLLGDYGL